MDDWWYSSVNGKVICPSSSRMSFIDAAVSAKCLLIFFVVTAAFLLLWPPLAGNVSLGNASTKLNIYYMEWNQRPSLGSRSSFYRWDLVCNKFSVRWKIMSSFFPQFFQSFVWYCNWIESIGSHIHIERIHFAIHVQSILMSPLRFQSSHNVVIRLRRPLAWGM